MPWDPEITSLTPYQMLWIRNQIQADRQQTYDELATLVEYGAAFINPQAVQRVKKAQDNTVRSDEEGLLRTLAKLSGGDIASAEQAIKTAKSKK